MGDYINNRIVIILKIALIFFISFVETIILIVMLFGLERAGLFMIQVISVDGVLIYPYESGGFFFGLILITNFFGAVAWHFITDWISKKEEITCCDDLTCIVSGKSMCENVYTTFK